MADKRHEPGQDVILTIKDGTISDQFGVTAQALVTRSRQYAIGTPTDAAEQTTSINPESFIVRGSGLGVSGALYRHPQFSDGADGKTSALDHVLMGDGRKVGNLVRPADAAFITSTIHGKTLG